MSCYIVHINFSSFDFLPSQQRKWHRFLSKLNISHPSASMSLGLQFTIYHLSLHSFRIGLVFHSVMMTKGSQFTTKKLISLLTQHSHVVMILEAVGTVVCAHGPFSICPVLSSLPLGFGHHIFPTALCKVGNDTLDVVPNKLFSVLILFLCV